MLDKVDEYEQKLRKVDFLLQQALRKVEVQSEAWNSLDTKSGLILGFIATTFAALLALNQNLSEIFLRLGISSLVISLLFSLKSFWPRNFIDPINLDYYYTKESLLKSVISMKNRAIVDTLVVHEKNENHLKEKSCWLKSAAFFLVVGALIFATGMMLEYKNTNSVKVEVCMTDEEQNIDDEPLEPAVPSPSVGTVIEKGIDEPSSDYNNPGSDQGKNESYGRTKGGF